MKRIVWIILLLSVGLNIGLLVRTLQLRRESAPVSRESWRAQPGERGHRAGVESRGPRDSTRWSRRFRGLDLSTAQREAMDDLRSLRHEMIGSRRGDMQKLYGELHDALLARELDAGRIAAVRRRLGKIQAELDSLVSDMLLHELEILTLPQREIYLQHLPWERFKPRKR